MFAYRFLLKTQNITTTSPLSYKIKRNVRKNRVRGFVTVFQKSAEGLLVRKGFCLTLDWFLFNEAHRLALLSKNTAKVK